MVYLYNLTGKSPRKLSISEKRVISGLKQLTEVLFVQHYRTNENQDQENMSNIALENAATAAADMMMLSNANIEQATNTATATDKENNGDFQRFLDSAMKNGAEQFCTIVMQQLTADEHIELSEEWHNGQLNAYDLARKRLFEGNSEDDMTKEA